MVLTVEDGTGVVGADSYVTRAYYISYVNDVYSETATDDETTDAAARRAFNYLNGLKWHGVKTHGRSGQSGAIPRDGLTDYDGNEVGSTEVPVEVMAAQCELMRVEVANPGTLSPSGTLYEAAVTMEKVDKLQISYDQSKITASVDNLIPYVSAAMTMIAPFLVGEGKPGRRMTDARAV